MSGERSQPNAFLAYRSRKHFANLDGLRFVCIAMVLWHHAQPIRPEAFPLLSRGFLGVDFFFVLSGFLITTLLLREEEARGRFSLKNFYIRRALRILPVYVFVVSAVSFYYIVVRGQTEYLQALPFYYLFLSNFLVDHIPILGITWSLSVEEQYYLIWPLILMILPRRFLVPAAVFLIGINVAMALGFPGGDPLQAGPLLFKLPNSTYAPIIMGSLAAVLLHREAWFARLDPMCGGRLGALAGCVVLAALMQFGPSDVRGIPNLLIHLTMTYILVCLVVREDNALHPFLAHPVISRIGVVSYGIYLYHLIALDIVQRSAERLGWDDAWLILVSYSLVAYGIADLSYRSLEAWFRRFRPRI